MMPEFFSAFAHPWILLGLGLVPLYGIVRRRQKHREHLPYPPLQYRSGPRRHRSGLLIVAECLLLTIVTIGLADPFSRDRLELMEDEGIDIALVLDVSLSMLATDFPPSRLHVLKRVAGEFIARSGGHRIGLVVFAADALVQTPLTTDSHTLLTLLDSVTVNVLNQTRSGGTAIGDALLLAGDRLQKKRLEGRDQALILITDGENNAGLDPTIAARHARRLGLRLYIIGIGGTEPVTVLYEGRQVGGDNPYQAVLDDAQLQAIAQEAEGTYYRATDASALEEIFAQLSRLESAPLEVSISEQRISRTPLFAIAAVPVFLFYLLLSGVILRRPLQ